LTRLAPWFRVLILAAACALTFPGSAIASEESETKHEQAQGHETLWKILNFAMLAGALGYLIRKKGPAFFRSRTEHIQRDLKESAKSSAEAANTYAEIERRLARLGAEIESLRTQAHAEFGTERERTRQETERRLRAIQMQSEQEIAAAAKAARQRLRAHTAELAVGLAAGRIRQQLTPEGDRALVDSMLHDLDERYSGDAPRAS